MKLLICNYFIHVPNAILRPVKLNGNHGIDDNIMFTVL